MYLKHVELGTNLLICEDLCKVGSIILMILCKAVVTLVC